ncbi:uncharacterized protein C5orf47 homolog [Tenrec ecaudatus]|uniref:uncharacterized protein C5orf47 homolog n=1 Tax=Tenrec ecaudatus TaxID=94439 RepID=UPI003F5A7EA3
MAARRGQERGPARFVYVTRFGSHPCGSVLNLGSRRPRGREEPREAQPAAPEGGGLSPVLALPPGPRPWAANAAAASASPRLRASRAQAPRGRAARAGLTQKKGEKYDFPIRLNEASKKIKKKKKEASVCNGVCKFISRMLEENEKYRRRLNSQRLSSGSSNHSR